MDWDDLRVFLAVARHGQLVGAARKLGLNHATVARRLAALETSLGAVLFDRRPTGSALTQAGERLLPMAERVEAEILAAAGALGPEQAEVSGTVRIGAPDGLGNAFLAPELGRLALRHPHLVVELVPLPRTFSLSRREADIAIVLERPAQGRLIVTKLADYSLGVYASPAYLARAGTPRRVEDIAAHVVVTGVEDFSYSPALDYTGALEAKATRLFRCASVMGRLQAVKQGVGIAILHDFTAEGQPDLVKVLPDMTFRRSYWMLSHPDSHEVRRVATCRNFLIQRFREERERFLRTEAAA